MTDPTVLASLASLAHRRLERLRGLSRNQVQQVVEQALGAQGDHFQAQTQQNFIAFVPGEAEAKANVTHLSNINNTPVFLPFNAPSGLSASQMQWQMSRAANGSNAFSLSLGMYSFVNSTLLSLMGSNSHVFSNTATASVSGIRMFQASMGPNFSAMPSGNYVLAMGFNATATASANYSIMGGSTANPPLQTKVLAGSDQYQTGTSHPTIPFWGRYATTTASLPIVVEASQVIANGTGASQPLPIWIAMS